MVPNKTIDWREFTYEVAQNKTSGLRRKQKNVEKLNLTGSIIPPVKNQMTKGACASSYAFAVASALESSYHHYNLLNKKVNKSLELSV